MIVLEGGAAMNANAEWLLAWGHIARACDEALAELHPLHPRRPDLLAMTRDAREAAGLPSVALCTAMP